MNYFDDISFIHVAKRITSADSLNHLVNSWGIGLMLGNGLVKKIVAVSVSDPARRSQRLAVSERRNQGKPLVCRRRTAGRAHGYSAE